MAFFTSESSKKSHNSSQNHGTPESNVFKVGVEKLSTGLLSTFTYNLGKKYIFLKNFPHQFDSYMEVF